MKPVDFHESNTTFAKNQTGFIPLPAHRTLEGVVVSCWRLSWWERLKVIFTGRIWSLQQTHNDPLQGQALSVTWPFQKGKR